MLPDVDTITVHRGIFHMANFLEGGLIDDGQEANAGYMTAKVDNEDFGALTVSADIVGNTLIIIGAIENRNIRIEVPVNATSSNHPLPEEGYLAVYTDEFGNEEEAISGLISVNFNNTDNNRMLVFFNFETENHSISEGRTQVDY
jgi:hypothetical protein